jgi:HEAT repeat-containing protein 5
LLIGSLDQTAVLAAHCIRTLLLQPHPTPADHGIARYLLPRLVNFVADAEPDDPEKARGHVALALVQYVSAMARDKGKERSQRASVGVALVVPALLARASGVAGNHSEAGDYDNEGKEVFTETSARLLELAAADPASFRAVVAGMSDAQKSFMEGVIRVGREGKGATGGAGTRLGAGDGQPSIALKMNFGSA